MWYYTAMKKYKFSYSWPVLVLLFAGMVIAILSAVLYTLSFVRSFEDVSTYNYVTLAVIYVVSLGYLVLAVSMLVNSYYSVDDKFFTLRWGILKNQLEIKAMTRVILDVEKHTLTVFYNEENYFVVKSATIPFPELVQSLREVNKKIVFDFASDSKKDEK